MNFHFKLRSPLASTCALLALATGALAQQQGPCLPTLESLDQGGGNGNDHSFLPSLSADGDWVAFESDATDLVAGDVNGVRDVFLRQISTGTTILVSQGPGGVRANADSFHAAVSENGDFVAFYSEASNISHNFDNNGVRDAFLFERANNRVRRISVSSSGVEGNAVTGTRGTQRGLDISNDGRLVVYNSNASTLVSGDTNSVSDIFLYNNANQTTKRVNFANGVQSNASSQNPVISGNGLFVAYMSSANNQGSIDTNGAIDIYHASTITNFSTQRVSVSSSGAQANTSCWYPAINHEGNMIAFDSQSTSLVSGDSGAFTDVFVHDLWTATTVRASLTWNGQEANNYAYHATISANGNMVGFTSAASNMTLEGAIVQSVYVRDKSLGTVMRWGESATGEAGFAGSSDPSFDSSGQRMAFASLQSLVPSDTNGDIDIYVTGCAPTGSNFCGGPTLACPCANTGLAGRGCHNSSSVGGALCQSYGSAQFSSDTVFLTVFGTGPTVPVLFFQGEGLVNGGLGTVLGDGIRCVGTNIQRLGVKVASGGYAEYGTGGDTPISVAGGLSIFGGTRYYQAWYRDPATYCTSNAFNVSNAVQIDWQP
jgi:Tol biopolymer transport system component